MAFYVINLALQFFSRKIFLEYLGTEILGLNTTAMNLLQFLNLAELGISSAVGFTLYKPLHDNDHTTINEIVTLQGHLYRRIAFMVIIGATILMCFFPLIFKKIDLPLWYAYASFGVLLISSILGYFFNYRQIVLSANQQDYKIMYSYKSIMLIKVTFQIIAVYHFSNGYVWWLVFEVIFAIIATFTLSWMTKRTFPYLSKTSQTFKELRLKYPEFTIQIRQLFFHKIGSFALTQTSPLIIYAYTSLTLVAIYGNYMIIVTGIQLLLATMFCSISAGIGNLVVEENITKNLSVLKELFSIRFIIIYTICFSTFILSEQFMTLWIGSQYILPKSTIIIILSILFINLSRITVDNFIQAYGLFSDIWSPIVESALNIGLSILLGHYWGINGILSGVLISLIFVIVIWKPYFLFSKRMNGHYYFYVKLYLIHLLIGLIVSLILYIIINKYSILLDTSWSGFIGNVIIVSLFFATSLTIVLLLFRCGIGLFFTRIKRMFFDKART